MKIEHTPPEIAELIDSDRWQHINQSYDIERFRILVPGEREVFFYNPPFKTVQQEIDGGSDYWTMPEARVDQIDPEKTIVLGDFGHGSDTTLALSYGSEKAQPTVIRLLWNDENPGAKNTWVKVSDSLAQFLEAIGVAL